MLRWVIPAPGFFLNNVRSVHASCTLPYVSFFKANERDKERDVGLCCQRVSIIHKFMWLKIWEGPSLNIGDEKQFLNSKDAGISFIEELNRRCVYVLHR